MFTREQTRKVMVGNVQIGNNSKIVIQSMCNIKTSHVKEVVQQILELEAYGCEIIRVSVLDEQDALSIKAIKENIHIPLVADIHFDYQLALKCIENGIDKIRINPGNIGSVDKIKLVVDACKKKHIPIRIGINSGSLEKDLQDQYGVCAKAMIESAKRHIKLLEDLDFYDIILSLKSSNFEMCVEAYQIAAELFPYPLHIGVTEPGPLVPGIVKSTLAMQKIISMKIGSTMRISLSDNPIEEIKVGRQILAALHLSKLPQLTSCPTCGRTKIDLIRYAKEIEDYLYTIKKDIHVAIMGCIVNGPGEAREADIGIAGGDKKGIIFKKGIVICTVDEENIVEELKKEINKM